MPFKPQSKLTITNLSTIFYATLHTHPYNFEHFAIYAAISFTVINGADSSAILMFSWWLLLIWNWDKRGLCKCFSLWKLNTQTIYSLEIVKSGSQWWWHLAEDDIRWKWNFEINYRKFLGKMHLSEHWKIIKLLFVT